MDYTGLWNLSQRCLLLLSLQESTWIPAQQPGPGTCLKFTVSSGVSEGTAPEATAITAAIGIGRCDMYHSGGEGAAASEAVSLSL